MEYGYFASVLIDIDFSKHIPERILLKANGREFWQYMEIHKHPKFCSKCSIIGHGDEDHKVNQFQVTAVEKIPRTRNDNPPGMEWKIASNKDKGKTAPVIPVVVESSKVTDVDKQAPVTVVLANQNIDNTTVVTDVSNNVVHAETFNTMTGSSHVAVAPFVTPDLDKQGKDQPVHVDTEDQLEMELARSEMNFCEAQMKLIKCKTAIATREDISSRTTNEKTSRDYYKDLEERQKIAGNNTSNTDVHEVQSNQGNTQQLQANNEWKQVGKKNKGSPFKFSPILNDLLCSELVVSHNKFDVLTSELGLDTENIN